MTETTKTYPKTARLSYECVDAQPRHFDFGEGYPEQWEYEEAAECPECGHVEPQVFGEDRCPECREGYLYAEGPMMNTWWPLPDRANPDSRDLIDVAMCIVRSGGEVGLALTGGGMDMSWDIAAAYIALGYYPPATLRLPDFAGMTSTAENVAIMDAMQKSYEAMKEWAERELEVLAQIREGLL